MRPLVLAAPLASAALAAVSPSAHACSQDSRILWNQPISATGELPANTVARMLVGEGDSERGDYSLSMERNNGELVAGELTVESHPGNSPYEDRYLHTFVPYEPLEVGARYLVKMRHISGDEELGRTVAFTAVEAVDNTITALPEVEVLSAYETPGEGDTGCDFDTARVFEVALTPAQGDRDELSVLHLYRVESAADDDWSYARAERVSADGSTTSQELRTDQLNQSGRCFVVVQEDITGAQSPPSPVACAPEPLTPDEGGGDSGAPPGDTVDSGSACRGCSASGGAVGFVAMLLTVLAGAGRRCS